MSLNSKYSNENSNKLKKLQHVIKKHLCIYFSKNKMNETFQYEKPIKNALFNMSEVSSTTNIYEDIQQNPNTSSSYFAESEYSAVETETNLSLFNLSDQTLNEIVIDDFEMTLSEALQSTKIDIPSPNISQFPFLNTTLSDDRSNEQEINSILNKIFHLPKIQKQYNFGNLEAIDV